MRIIVIGDRRWFCPDFAEAVLSQLLLRYGPGLVIVQGRVTGIDRLFAEACAEQSVEQGARPAEWGALNDPEAIIGQDFRGSGYNANAGPTRS